MGYKTREMEVGDNRNPQKFLVPIYKCPLYITCYTNICIKCLLLIAVKVGAPCVFGYLGIWVRAAEIESDQIPPKTGANSPKICGGTPPRKYPRSSPISQFCPRIWNSAIFLPRSGMFCPRIKFAASTAPLLARAPILETAPAGKLPASFAQLALPTSETLQK